MRTVTTSALCLIRAERCAQYDAAPDEVDDKVASRVIEPDAVEPRDAVDFGAWFTSMTAALSGDGVSDVPCGTCTACCCASQFVEVGPDEADALASIPRALLFPAPGAPTGSLVMGYDEHGRCPMFGDGTCSIYEHRPQACRVYDCRVFAATGVYPDESEKASVADTARRWVFRYASPSDRRRRELLQTRAQDLWAPVERSLGTPGSPSATEVAIRAISEAGVAES